MNETISKTARLGTTHTIPRGRHGEYFVRLLSGKSHRDQTASGLYVETGFSPNEHAEVEGEVVSTPLTGKLEMTMAGESSAIKPGDYIAFSYQVVSARDQHMDQDEIYREIESENPLLTIWENGKGGKIFREYVLGGSVKASYLQKNQKPKPNEPLYNEVDRFQGKPEDFDHWFSQYYTDSSAYREFPENLVTINGQKYWKVKAEQVHAHIPRHLVSIQHVAIDDTLDTLAPPDLPYIEHTPDLTLVVPTPAPGQLLCRPRPKPGMLSFVNQPSTDWVEIIHGHPQNPESGNIHDLSSGWVYAPLDRCPEYTFFGQDYIVVKIDQVLAHSLVKPSTSKHLESRHLVLQ